MEHKVILKCQDVLVHRDHTLWKMGYMHMNEKSEHCTDSCTAELKNLLEDRFLVFCVTFPIFTRFFFLFKCLSCDLNICTHTSNVFYTCAHTYCFLIFGFLIFNTTFAFIIILV